LLYQVEYFSLLADECTDISTIEELSVVICWVENGLPVEHFIKLVPLRKPDASTIYETLTDCMKNKGLVIGNMISWSNNFSGRHNGVQALLNKNSPRSIFVHCHCHRLVFKLQTIFKVSNMFTTTLWKHFHYSPKWAECLKEIQRVLEMLEFKIVKSSDTQW